MSRPHPAARYVAPSTPVSAEAQVMARADWPERLRQIANQPDLLDKMTSADLKRTGKMLAEALHKTGMRAAKAEIALREASKTDDATLAADLDRVTYRLLVVTGGRPPAWSYLHREAVELLHEYRAFETRKASKGWQVVGTDPAGKEHPLYDFDYAGLGVTQAASEARLMAAHLRQSFLPRDMEQPQ